MVINLDFKGWADKAKAVAKKVADDVKDMTSDMKDKLAHPPVKTDEKTVKYVLDHKDEITHILKNREQIEWILKNEDRVNNILEVAELVKDKSYRDKVMNALNTGDYGKMDHKECDDYVRHIAKEDEVVTIDFE